MKIDATGWVDEAIGIYYGADSFGRFAQGQPKWLVLHGTAWPAPTGTALNIATIWANEVAAGNLGASTHFIIDKVKGFTQGISLLDTASGNSGAPDSPRDNYLPAGNLNMCTVSIECCKYDMNDMDELTDYQISILFPLVADICDFTGIPRHVWSQSDVSKGGIIGHAQCDAKYRSHCPGPMPWKDLQDYLKGSTPMFTNERCVTVWNSTGFGKDDAKRSSGIFAFWRDQWVNHKNYMGAPSTPEYPWPMPDGSVGVARNFGSNTVSWYDGVSEIVN